MATSNWNDAAVIARLRKAAFRGVVKGANLVRTEMIRLIIQTAKTGRIYQRRGVTHQASAPGEPPASDRGYLVNSIRIEANEESMSARVVTSAAYAPYLEYGTQTIEPRPFARPAIINTRRDVERAIQSEIVKEMGGG